MTFPLYRSLAKQFIKETEAAASHNLIDPTRANWVKAAIEIALDSERAGGSGVGSPVTSEPVGAQPHREDQGLMQDKGKAKGEGSEEAMITENGHQPRVPPINLTYQEAKRLLRAKEGFGWPPGTVPWLTFEAARAKIAKAVAKAERVTS